MADTSTVAEGKATSAPPQDVHAERRRRFMRQIGDQAAALVFSNPVRVRSNDTTYAYRASSDLWYLTGCTEPDAVALLLPGHEEHPFVLFVRPRDFSREVWDGPRLGLEGAHERLGADKALAIGDLDEALPKMLLGRSMLVHDLGRHPEADGHVLKAYGRAQALARGRQPSPTSIVDLVSLLHEQRLIKGPEEIERLRTACRISAEGHRVAMARTRPGLGEFQLQAEIEHAFKRAGATGPSYESIVGSGASACVLHYISNRGTLQDGDLLLVDAGAEYQMYAGDITRTWPVNGRFEGRQRMIYDLVLRAQQAVIRKVKPGLLWSDLHATAVEVITTGLIDLGILEGPVEKAIEDKAFRPFFMHGTGHWLGMDVHDVGTYVRSGSTARALEPGMVFTVEPGIYFHPDEPLSPTEYRGIGVRIEDDILVTADGCEVLTADVPKEPEEVEALVGSDPAP
jgi:Xaa-Pro aminopeptidase